MGKNMNKATAKPTPPQPPPRPDGLASSPFSKLAPETRNHIYSFALARPEPFLIGSTSVQPRLCQGKRKDATRRDYRGLLLSCRTLSTEGTHLFYAANTFVFAPSGPRDSTEMLDYFSAKIGARNAAALRDIVLKMDVTEGEADVVGESWGLDRCGLMRARAVRLFGEVRRRAKGCPDCLFTIRAAFQKIAAHALRTR
ncbi:hypothetical protein LTR36_003112 [Oleoguttula mirabilis]|uniref:Uncharacterized protein n=1 Tax=Oleoguttula mirabilis TaxID=1507867 RepID=A0AAV9JWL9_9PEZI|nr:hypothetical protein LTR36_003112 [Oleoguttula mirabilis]